MKNTLETSGEDVKTTLETGGEDVHHLMCPTKHGNIVSVTKPLRNVPSKCKTSTWGVYTRFECSFAFSPLV